MPSDDDDGLYGLNLVSIVLPFVATILSLFFGMFIGGAAVWILKPAPQPIELVKSASIAELQLMCQPVVDQQMTQITKIREEITALEAEVLAREAEVDELRSRSAAQDEAAAARLADASQALASARRQLRKLNDVKEQLVEQLTLTKERLVQTEANLQNQVAVSEALRDENFDLRDDVIVQHWFRVVNDAKLKICEKGGKKKTEACRESVDIELSSIKREFVHCIRSNQAAPSVELLQKGQDLPHFARMFDQESRFLAGWYLQMCDPTLPEVDVSDPALAAPTAFR